MPVDLTLSSHRPWPLPTGPPVMKMTWDNLLFAHWPIPIPVMQKLLPAGLTIDTYEGEAWIGVVPFLMSGIKARLVPSILGTDQFPEINVRTYICQDGKLGVYFFSLDAASWLAVQAARAWYHLPYFHADITSGGSGDAVTYHSIRRTAAGQSVAEFRAEYAPTAPASCGGCGALAHWLTERYCLYIVRRGVTYRADIHHSMWPLQPADAEITVNTMTAPIGLELPETAPLLHFARHLEVVAWPPRRV